MTRCTRAALRDALPEVHAALERMLAKPRDVMPFVRVEISDDDPRFVQFAGASGCPLFFDSPPLKIFAHEVGFGLPGLKGTPAEIGAELAILGLRDQGVADDDLVVIVEQNTRGPEPSRRDILGLNALSGGGDDNGAR